MDDDFEMAGELMPLGSADGMLAAQSAANGQRHVNPAMVYLLSLNSDKGRRTMQSLLNRVAGIIWQRQVKDEAGNVVEVIKATWENAPWASLRREQVQMVLYALNQERLAPSTRRTCLAAIRGVAREAWHSKQIDEDAYKGIAEVKAPRGSRTRKGRAIDSDEVDSLLTAIPEKSSDLLRIRNQAIIALLLGSGLRKSEACGLLTANVDMERRVFTIIGKGDKQAEVFIHSGAVDYVQAWIDARGADLEYFFNPINRHGQIADRGLSASGMDKLLQTAAVVAAIRPFSAHDTRRTFATRLFASGVDSMKVRDLMRHSSVQTTEIYNIVSVEDLRNAVESVDLL